MLLIRYASVRDVPAINKVYNEAVRTTTATFDTDEKTEDQQLAWLLAHDARHPVIVAEWDDQVVGWAALSRWSDRQAYEDTAESSFYVSAEFRGRGIGRKLKERLLEIGRELGLHVIIARVAEGSVESLHLNESCGFVTVGVMKQVGHKFGKRLDVHIMQYVYRD